MWAMSSVPASAPQQADERWSLGSNHGPAKPAGEEAWQLGGSSAGSPRIEGTPRPAKPAAPKEVAFAPTAAAMPAMTPAPALVHVSDDPMLAAAPELRQGPTTPGFTPSQPAGTSPSIPAVDVHKPSGARACSNCGTPLPEGFAFCGRCGTKVVDSQGAKTMYLSGSPPAVEERIRGRLLALRPDGSPGEAVSLHEGENKFGREMGVPFLAGDRLLSPVHAIFTCRGRQVMVRDHGSLNGVFVKLREDWELHSGDVFRIGQQLLRYDDVRDSEVLVSPAAGEDTFVLGSPDLGYWGRLVQIVAKDRAGNVYLLFGTEVTLGRERAQITFPLDGFVSASHAAVLRRGEQTILSDRGSSNGTYVRVTGEAQLQYGDLVLLGQNLFRVELFA
jgi:pSer/pThr/pTyr-binding forkhead associated (FHA) protein